MVARIDELTDEQRNSMVAYAEELVNECLRSGTTEEDWIRAERGIRGSYRTAKLVEPKVIVRTTSPLACVLAGPIATSLLATIANNSSVGHTIGVVSNAVSNAVSSAVHPIVDSAVSDAISDTIHSVIHPIVNSAVSNNVGCRVGSCDISDITDSSVDGTICNAIKSAVNNTVNRTVSNVVFNTIGISSNISHNIHNTIDRTVRKTVGSIVNDTWSKYNGGSLWAAWSTWRLFFIDKCDLRLSNYIMELAEIWRDLSVGAGWWWPHEKFCIVAPRHDKIHLDDRNRLHYETGPSLLYPDGWGIWSWHGVQIPREWIEQSDKLDPRIALTWDNIEQRRCAVEIIGWEKVLSQLQPKTIDNDHDPMVGTLLEVDLPDVPKQQFLKVLCGTGRTFVLPCVHNNFTTALDANAASWGEEGIDPSLVRNRQART